MLYRQIDEPNVQRLNDGRHDSSDQDKKRERQLISTIRNRERVIWRQHVIIAQEGCKRCRQKTIAAIKQRTARKNDRKEDQKRIALIAVSPGKPSPRDSENHHDRDRISQRDWHRSRYQRH